MANEISATASLTYANTNIAQKLLSITGKTFTISGSAYVEGAMAITTSATALPIGNLSTLGWYIIKNNDATNPVDLMTSTAGAHYHQLSPGEFTIGRFASAVTAPAVKATGGTCQVEYLILEA